MPDSLRRLAIHPLAPAGADGAETVDLTLPADSPVGSLIPPIVDVVLDRSLTPTHHPVRWCLTRIGGERLDTSMTLRENAIHDGDLILLTTVPSHAPARRRGESSSVVAELADRPVTGALPGAVRGAGFTTAIASAMTLAWAGGTAGSAAHLWTAGALSAAGATGAVLIDRPARRVSSALSVIAVIFAMVTGFLSVPNTSWAPTFLLVASPGFAVSILLLHMTCDEMAVLHAFAAATAAIAATGLVGVATGIPFGSAGAVLTGLSLAALSVAPKIAVTVAGLGPSRPEIGNRRAAVGHRILTGVVAGWSCSMTLGVVAVAVSGAVPPVAAALFAADVGVLLVLRQRTHVDMHRRLALSAAGLCALAAATFVVVTAQPGHAFWICAATAAAGLAAVGWQTRGEPPNPAVRQLFQTLECLALAAVVPLAAWVTGVYGLARDLSLG